MVCHFTLCLIDLSLKLQEMAAKTHRGPVSCANRSRETVPSYMIECVLITTLRRFYIYLQALLVNWPLNSLPRVIRVAMTNWRFFKKFRVDMCT